MLVAEALLVLALLVLTPSLIDGTAYLVPFVLGIVFITLWGAQAVAAYHAARRRQAASRSPNPHSPAAAIAWLGIPLLLWGSIFWLVGAGSSSPAAVLDRFVARWESIAEDPRLAASIAEDPEDLSRDAATSIATLRGLCRAGVVAGDCEGSLRALGRDLEFRILRSSSDDAAAVLEVVRYERRPSRFLGIFEGADLITVPYEPLLRIRLGAVHETGLPGLFGSSRWRIVSTSAVESSVEAIAPPH